MKSSEPEVRTITLTGAPPVRIQTADWPTVAQAIIATGGVNLRVRQHADGRRLIYGVGGVLPRGVVRAGVQVPALDGRPDQGATQLAAADVARALTPSLGLAALLLDRLFASMKPETLR